MSMFKGSTNPWDIQGLKLYLLENKGIEKESDNTEDSVSNTKYVVDNFIGLYNKHGWECLSFWVVPSLDEKNYPVAITITS